MNDDKRIERDAGSAPDEPITDARGLFRRYPKLQILLIAAVAYAILIGMVLFVLVLVIRG